MTNSDISLFNIINERHSVREYDPTYKIHKEEIEEMLKAAASAPSSSNLQPWRFLVIQDEDVKKELQGIAFNQAPIGSCSAVIAVIGDTKM